VVAFILFCHQQEDQRMNVLTSFLAQAGGVPKSLKNIGREGILLKCARSCQGKCVAFYGMGPHLLNMLAWPPNMFSIKCAWQLACME
jgi:hypothetical protein